MATDYGLDWSSPEKTAIPYEAYHDEKIYADEQQRIFRGLTWNYLALDAEIPEAGDFLTTYVGDTPVIVNRDAAGIVHAMVNRCAHRGATVRREAHGNANEHVCCYHQWTYDLQGNLMGVPFRRGIKGKGGLPKDFDKNTHCLEKLTVRSYRGAIFGTFGGEDLEPLEDYLDTPICDHLDRILHKPLKVLGHQRQIIHGNWKLYSDNLRDPNHGGLLHMYQITFGIARLSNWGGARMDKHHRHNISFTAEGTESKGKDDYKGTSRGDGSLTLRDPSLLKYKPEFPDRMTLAILSVFPNVVFHQIGNSLATRQVRTRGPAEFEVYWTYFGYEDDDDEMTRHRLKQANLAGPGGYISMEDGEAIELVHAATAPEKNSSSFVQIGGTDAPSDQDTLVTEVPMRGFWKYYAEIMQLNKTGVS